jgi:uncharacterized protein YndB with AHSA1/START domain
MNKDVRAKAEMLIRRPVSKVFNAFVDPAITTKFWFTKSSGRLATGNQVTWTWEMYGVSTKVRVRNFEKNRRILIEWDGYSGRETVEWKFKKHGPGATFVTVTNCGFRGTDDAIVRQALDSTGGFTWLLAGAKAYLEHGIQLNLTADAHPPGV